MKKFDERNFRPFDTTVLHQWVDKYEWITRIKKSKWYGPYGYMDNKINYPNVYFFMTADDSGNSQGLSLAIWMNDKHKEIWLYALDKNSSVCSPNRSY